MIPRAARLRWDTDTNVVVDGNSITVYGFPLLLYGQAPVSTSGASTHECGVGGQTWRHMNGLDGGSAADVDGAYVAGKRNVLIAWETTNLAAAGGTPQSIADECAAYVAGRRALHPDWIVMVMTSLPRYATGNPALTQRLIDVDDIMRRTWRSMGIDYLFDTRARVPVLGFSGFDSADFIATQTYWNETSDWLHPTMAGHELITAKVASALRALPAKTRNR